jgi:TPP-dependent pyruvate/acetoin dehydrogenase alpha subunit
MNDAVTGPALYRRMLLIRRFEERMQELFAANRLPGFLHLSIGQEATAVGVCAALDRTDHIVTTHRGHGHIIAKGAALRPMVAELFARAEGACGGVAGSMHLTDPDAGVICADAIVGGGIGLATGAAFGAKYRGTGGVAVAFFGDGAANQGLFHESLNMAALWKLPAVYVCENNLYAEMSHQSLHTNIRDIATRAGAYDIPGVIVDGNDVEAVLDATRTAVERARDGGGPTLLECKTYRIRGHFEGDAQKYKDAAEVAGWAARDPLAAYGRALLDRSEATDADLAAYDDEARAAIDDAVAFAEAGTSPKVTSLTALTYADAAS